MINKFQNPGGISESHRLKMESEKLYRKAKSLNPAILTQKEQIVELATEAYTLGDPEVMYKFARKYHNFLDYHIYVEKIIQLQDLQVAYKTALNIPNLTKKEIDDLQNIILTADPMERKVLKLSISWSDIVRYSVLFARDIPGADRTALIKKFEIGITSAKVSSDTLVQSFISLAGIPDIDEKYVIKNLLQTNNISVQIGVARKVAWLLEPVIVEICKKPEAKANLKRLLNKAPSMKGENRQHVLDMVSTYEVLTA